MSSAHKPPELADLLPDWCKHKVVAVLRAFFDESGIHARSPVTAICGFIGSKQQWRPVLRQWRATMNGRIFHYKNMRMEGELLDKLSTILAESSLEVVGGGFVGEWKRAIYSGAIDWPVRFPSCYHMVFEMSSQRMEDFSVQHWNGEPIDLTFSRQDEYASRAEEVWRTYKGNGHWPHLIRFGYAGSEDFAELQAADMIAYETFQCLKEGASGGWAWDKWPLVRKLLAKGKPMHGFAQTETQFVRTLREQDERGRRYLQTVPKPKSA